MKKIVIYLVCITIFLQLGFQALQIVTQLISHKIKVETAIKSGQFQDQLVQFTESDLVNAKWDGDHEFEINNEKYDLVEKTITHQGIVYTCINDKLEKALLKALDRAAQKSKSQQVHSSKSTLLFCTITNPLIGAQFSIFLKKVRTIQMPMVLDGYPNLPFQPPSVLA